jgi:hypothetical protein
VIPERWPAETEDLLMQLVTWECLDNQSVCPKLALRQLSLPALSVAYVNIENWDANIESRFAVAKMVKVEMMYRMGKLVGDWTYLRLEKKINLRYTPAKGEAISGFHDVNSA